MVTTEVPMLAAGRVQSVDPVAAGEALVRLHGARAVTMAISRPIETGAGVSLRISANDAYAALEEAVRKVTRAALPKYRLLQADGATDFGESLAHVFPDPAAYLARAIRSVVIDQGRAAKREIPALSLDEPVAADLGEARATLGDLVPERRVDRIPEADVIERADRTEFRTALAGALGAIPANYLQALARDLARERNAGALQAPVSDRDRQTLCRARAALASVLRRECGEDNPYIRMLNVRQKAKVRTKSIPSPSWSGERQDALFRRLLESGWAERAQERPDDSVEEAIVNDVTEASAVAPPSPEVRQAMRVIDLYTLGHSMPQSPIAAELYIRAREERKEGRLEEALLHFKACVEAEPSFTEARSEIAVTYSRLGKLREALKINMGIVETSRSAEDRCIAATNASDIYLTWFDSGRRQERNIEMATRYALLAMERPTPMRACNLILAYVKNRFFHEARQTMSGVMKANTDRCPTEKFLSTLFQIRDADLIRWWAWLEEEMREENYR
jgi:tetratricopeptide (TPR) repeat protein